MKFFDFKGNQFTTLTNRKGEPWLVAKEICDYLEIVNITTALQTTPPLWKKKITIPELASSGRGGDNGNRWIINEPALYQLIARSNKKEAIEFQQWLYCEVLPSIRKTGQYRMDQQIEAPQRPQLPTETPADYLEALEHLVIVVKDNRILEAQVHHHEKAIKKLKPKAEQFQRLAESTGLVRITDAAKIMGVKPRWFARKLVEDEYCYKSRGKIVPNQYYVDRGWMELKYVEARDDKKYSYRQTFITPLGVIRFQEIYNPIPPGTQLRLFA